MGVKMCKVNKEQPYILYVQPKALISAEAKKLPIKDVFNYLNDIQ